MLQRPQPSFLETLLAIVYDHGFEVTFHPGLGIFDHYGIDVVLRHRGKDSVSTWLQFHIAPEVLRDEVALTVALETLDAELAASLRGAWPR